VKFHKKPVLIDADRWWDNSRNPDLGVAQYYDPEVESWRTCKQCGIPFHNHGWVYTLDGGRIVCPGDWIITDEDGVSTCKPSVFDKTYVPA